MNVLFLVEEDIRTKLDIARDEATVKGLPFRQELAMPILAMMSGAAGQIGLRVARPVDGESGRVIGSV